MIKGTICLRRGWGKAASEGKTDRGKGERGEFNGRIMEPFLSFKNLQYFQATRSLPAQTLSLQSLKAVGGIILYFYLSKVALDALASRIPDTVQGRPDPLW